MKATVRFMRSFRRYMEAEAITHFLRGKVDTVNCQTCNIICEYGDDNPYPAPDCPIWEGRYNEIHLREEVQSQDATRRLNRDRRRNP